MADEYEFLARTGHGNVDAAKIAQESYLTVVIGPHERDDYDVAFLSLKAVDRVDCEQMTHRAQNGRATYKPP